MAPLTAKLAGLGTQNGANMAKIIDPKMDHFFDASWGRFFLDFGGFLVPKWKQVGTQIGSKMDVNFER